MGNVRRVTSLKGPLSPSTRLPSTRVTGGCNSSSGNLPGWSFSRFHSTNGMTLGQENGVYLPETYPPLEICGARIQPRRPRERTLGWSILPHRDFRTWLGQQVLTLCLPVTRQGPGSRSTSCRGIVEKLLVQTLETGQDPGDPERDRDLTRQSFRLRTTWRVSFATDRPDDPSGVLQRIKG